MCLVTISARYPIKWCEINKALPEKFKLVCYFHIEVFTFTAGYYIVLTFILELTLFCIF